MIGNGLFNYDFNSGHGNPVYDAWVDVLDGFCMEHLMSFESVNRGAGEAPFIKVEALENLIQLRERLVQAGKYLLIRAYPGPLGISAFMLYTNILVLLSSYSSQSVGNTPLQWCVWQKD